VPALPVATIQSTKLVHNDLPGEPVPYYLASGEGARFETAGQLWTVIARSQDSGGAFDAAYIEGPRGSSSPFFALPDAHRTYTVLNGEVEVDYGPERRRLTRGDSIHVPEGVPFAYRFNSHFTRLLYFAAPGGTLDALLASDVGTKQRIYSAAAATDSLILPLSAAIHESPSTAVSEKWDDYRPSGVEPFALRSMEGDHREWPDVMNTLRVRGENTGGRYFVVETLSSQQPYIIRHFHAKHTENFLCLSGRVWLWVNGEEVLLTEGDFLHAPAGTVHSFAISANNTKMLGFLTTDVFERFFDVTAVATENKVYSEGLVNPSVLFNGLGANPDLDMVIFGPPPTRMLGPSL
jgi:quercetin 2,3-dioxygenase